MIEAMSKYNPNKELLSLIKDYKLDSAKIVELLHCSRTSVYCWTREPGDDNFSAISPAMLRLLALELGAEQPAYLT